MFHVEHSPQKNYVRSQFLGNVPRGTLGNKNNQNLFWNTESVLSVPRGTCQHFIAEGKKESGAIENIKRITH
jgi:hypothetical protein